MPRLTDRLYPEVRARNKLQELVESDQFDLIGRTWYSGIVCDVDTLGVANPLYSVKVKVDEGITTGTEILDMEWFEPLMPLHIQRVPERFERVLVTFINVMERRVGLWASRKFEKSAGSQKVRTANGSSMQDNFTYGGIPFRVGTPTYDALSKNHLMGDLFERKEGLKSSRSKWLNVMPGDVVMQGGYNSAVRHTYDPWTGKSRLQLQAGYGSNDTAEEILDYWDNNWGPENTGGYHSAIHILEKSPFDALCQMPHNKGGFDIPFHPEFNDFGSGAATGQEIDEQKMFGDAHANTYLDDLGALDSFVALTTYGHIRLVNIDPASHQGGTNPVCHVAMAEPLIPILDEIIDILGSLGNMFLNHEHMHPMGPTMLGPTSKAYTPLMAKIAELNQRITSVSDSEKLNRIASKHVAVN